MQMYGGRLCANTLTNTGRRERSPHNPGFPRYPRACRLLPKMVLACEYTHAALSLEARHWLLKRVAGGSGRPGAGEPFRTGDHSGRRVDVALLALTHRASLPGQHVGDSATILVDLESST